MMLREGYLYPEYLRQILSFSQRTLIRVEGQLVPIVIWGGLFYYYKWHKVLTKRLKSHKAEGEP